MKFDPSHHIGWSRQAEADDAAFAVAYLHRLRFTSDAFDPGNPVLAEIMAGDDGEPARALFFIDNGVTDAWADLPDRIKRYAGAHAKRIKLVDPVHIVTGGEHCKNDLRLFESAARAIEQSGICRHSYVVTIGGGAVLDAVGFAASTAHRGVRQVRCPTTTLAQADSGIGVKNGINAFGKKNFLGCFSPPWAVINDDTFLSTLEDRDWRCGLSEAVKVALLKDASFFREIVAATPRLARRDHAAVRPIVKRAAELHLHHIVYGGDPFELNAARPLDFGHWAAHKIEQMTDFEVRHGEAVAMGLALDVVYSAMIGLLEWSDVKQIVDCLAALGFALHHPAMDDHATLFDGLEEFREHLGGRLTITLVSGIGTPVDVHEIDRTEMVRAANWLADGMAQRDVGSTLTDDH